MAQFHFVEDYENMVARLVSTLPLDEAMSSAVGGRYHEVGAIERDILLWAGLRDGMQLVDLGCGSGRLACALGGRLFVEYLGTDIVQQLLDYAKSKSPAHYQFKLHRALNIPMPDRSADFVSAFSVFTHLLHSESFIYMRDIKRVLKPSGTFVFSFLEFADPNHWIAFSDEIDSRSAGGTMHLNSFIERSAIETWYEKLDLDLVQFVGGQDAPWGGEALWQSVAVLKG